MLTKANARPLVVADQRRLAGSIAGSTKVPGVLPSSPGQSEALNGWPPTEQACRTRHRYTRTRNR